MRASKALGRHHDSDAEEVSDPEIASEDEEGGGQGGQDPFFQHDADVFNDPFFTAVRASLPSPIPNCGGKCFETESLLMGRECPML